MSLVPCGRCRRHVRGRTCPFCGAAVLQAPPRTALIGRVGRAAIFAGASACWTAASTPTSSTTVSNAQSAGMAAISGVVTDAATHQPIAGASVQLIPQIGATQPTQTDASGHYHFANVAAGTYTLAFDAVGGGHLNQPISVKAGEVRRADIALETPSNIPMPYGAPPARRRVV